MGAKQSKRSVDISGKEAEGAGEVAAAGAGGEGRVEAIADLDNLKPQLNGDAQHIEPLEEKTEKEKQLDSGTPENEKDATTEKETEAEPKDAPLTNGESEHKPEAETENGETPATEEAKKPKKEKVKKKWSLRSISFSRKDKPKHEKKEKKDKKDDEGKTNGDADKVPEEAAEATEVATETTVTEETKPAEIKDEQTPETPVTEPLTNGTSTPESPKVESPAEPAPAPAPELNDRPDTKTVTEPEQLPLNGLSLEESKKEVTEVAETVESITEEPVAPAPETHAKTEVCVERMNSIDSTPPPLPANPPPSSVASFAASTMAPELTDASLITTTPAANTPTEVEAPIQTQETISKTEALITESPIPTEPIVNVMPIKDEVVTETVNLDDDIKTESIVLNDAPKTENLEVSDALENKTIEISDDLRQTELLNGLGIENVAITDMPIHNIEPVVVAVTVENIIETTNNPMEEELPKSDIALENVQITVEEVKTEVIINDIAAQNGGESLVTETVAVALQNGDHITNGNHFTNGIESDKLNGDFTETEEENIKNKTKDVTKEIELNGSFDDSAKIVVKAAKIIEEVIAIATEAEDVLPPPLEEDIEGEASSEEERSLPPPPPTQEIIPSHDKLADLIPEVPELPTETVQETTSDVAVAN